VPGAGKSKTRRASPGRGTSWERLCKDALRLPGVETGTSYKTKALHVRKKLLARLREDGETVAVRVDFLDREVLLEADPAAFFLTDHYRAYPWILLRLDEVRHASALEVLERAWRAVAPRRLVASLTGPRASPSASRIK
jgi:hypothetical protein